MSYYQPPGQGYPPYQNNPPQPGYSPSSNPYPPSHSPYPQQGYAPPPPMQNHQYPPPGGHPPQGYPPSQQHPPYGQPPPQGYPPQAYPPGYPPQGHPSQAYPPSQQHAHAQQGYGAPQGGYGAPPQPYGAPAYAGPPTPASPGYVPNAWRNVPTDMNRVQAESVELRDAMKGFGTNEAKLIRVLAQVPGPLHMQALRFTYEDRFRRNLLKDIESETSGYFRDGLMAIVRGPLEQDVFLLNKGITGLGTKESLLDDVLLGRTNADINAIKTLYPQLYRRDLLSDVRGDLSMKTERLFDFVLAARRAEESAPVLPQEVDHAVSELHRATQGTNLGTDQVTVCQVLSSRSSGQLRAINQAFGQKYRRSLDEVLRSEFSGHMQDALRLMLARAVDPVKSDADQLEESMRGMGTKDELLVNRVVRCHWDRAHMQQVKNAYRQFYKQDLASRIRGETRGDYEKLMVACVG